MKEETNVSILPKPSQRDLDTILVGPKPRIMIKKTQKIKNKKKNNARHLAYIYIYIILQYQPHKK